METLLMTCFAAAVIACAWQGWMLAKLKRERDMYVNRTQLYRDRWESSQRWVRRYQRQARELRRELHQEGPRCPECAHELADDATSCHACGAGEEREQAELAAFNAYRETVGGP